MAVDVQRMLTRNWKKKVLQDEKLFNCITSDEKEQILKLCKPPNKKKSKVEEFNLQDINKSSQSRLCPLDFEWIMCDDCQKWRIISCEDAKEFYSSRKWFCSLNKNPAFNQCFVPEESCSDLMEIIRKNDLNVVIYGLKLGDLVWGKMTSYPKWPALVTCDPENELFIFDQSDNVEYHLEFLGPKHSHAWIDGSLIKLYSVTAFKNILPPTKKTKRKKFQTYRNLKQYHDLQSAIKEANALVDVANSKRMECCVFRNADGKEIVAASQRESREYMERPIENSTNKAGYINDSTIDEICCKPSRCCNIQHSNEQDDPAAMSCYNKANSKNSLLTLTLQQRLSLDIEVYKKSEVAFTIDLKQFLARNNLHLETTYWENVPVNCYQLFQTVNELGGYEKVTKKSKWSYIYQEMTNTYERYKGTLAKKFYYRNLYAYSLCILGNDYECIIQAILREERKKDNSFVLEKPQKKAKIVHELEEDSICTLYQKFEELETVNRRCCFEEEMMSAQKKLGIFIQFHDESSRVYSSLEYKSPLIDPVFPDDCHILITEGLQDPDILAFDSNSDKNWTPNSSNYSKSDHDNSSINLEDLHTLRDQIELLSSEINI